MNIKQKLEALINDKSFGIADNHDVIHVSDIQALIDSLDGYVLVPKRDNVELELYANQLISTLELTDNREKQIQIIIVYLAALINQDN